MESSPLFTPVAPTKPASPYIGGKRYLARRLVQLIEEIPHRTYAEPFVGMGGVFLRRRWRPAAEVINDWSWEVATFYRILQRHYVAFLDMLRFQITTRAEFERLTAVDPATLTDLERAARFLYLQRTAFGGRVDQRHFGVSPGRPGRFDVTKVGPMLEDLHERLAGVVIERLPWAAFLDRYDTDETLFYLDPPYFGSEGDYGEGMFSAADFEPMAAKLKGLQGRFILSLNDHPTVREIFAGFEIRGVETHYGLAGQGAKKAGEVIICGPVSA
ncbi:DNA adenine methylase [Phenylobacterium sp.]|uniref:DNA adenine methylase n=1 Tax=Phenylobacterium sp. TaxID=1871053 RepID=UPI0035B17B61